MVIAGKNWENVFFFRKKIQQMRCTPVQVSPPHEMIFFQMQWLLAVHFSFTQPIAVVSPQMTWCGINAFLEKPTPLHIKLRPMLYKCFTWPGDSKSTEICTANLYTTNRPFPQFLGSIFWFLEGEEESLNGSLFLVWCTRSRCETAT